MLGLGRPILTADELNAHRTTVGNVQDVVYAPLYDSASYAAAGQLALNFFATPVGQGTTTAPGATGNKTLADTNMQQAGILAKGNEFYMTGQEFLFFPGLDIGRGVIAFALTGDYANDTIDVGKSGFVTLQVGSNRQYIQDGPLMLFPPTARLAVAAAIGYTNTAGTQSTSEIDYATWAGEPYAITPIYLEATQGFQETIQWPALVTISATARLFSRLRGYLIRNAQ